MPGDALTAALSSRAGAAITAFGVALSLAPSDSALADWRFTRWGMTPSEVASSASGLIVTNDDADPEWPLRWRGRYVAAGVNFRDVLFRFAASRLVEVELVTDTRNLARIRAALVRECPSPLLTDPREKRARAPCDLAQVRTMPDGVFVSYRSPTWPSVSGHPSSATPR